MNTVFLWEFKFNLLGKAGLEGTVGLSSRLVDLVEAAAARVTLESSIETAAELARVPLESLVETAAELARVTLESSVAPVACWREDRVEGIIE